MTYEAFKSEYTKLFNAMMGYTCEQAGSSYFAERMAELADQYPEYENRIDNEA